MSHLLIPQEFDAHINSLLNASWLVLGFEDRDGLRQAQTHTIFKLKKNIKNSNLMEG